MWFLSSDWTLTDTEVLLYWSQEIDPQRLEFGIGLNMP